MSSRAGATAREPDADGCGAQPHDSVNRFDEQSRRQGAPQRPWSTFRAMPARAKDTYLDHLADVPLFSAASRKDLQRIARASDEIEVKAGRVLVEQGRLGHEFFLILDGKATVRRNN